MENFIKSILPSVDKPSRYTGGEYNTPHIDLSAACRFAMCFPDIYEIGMSNLGIEILYGILNRMEGVSCERCFAPWHDMAEQLRKHKMPLFSLESKTPLHKFDMVGFSMQYELSYTNVLLMLELAGISFLAKDRKEQDPVLIAGGPSCVNPYPFADFFDIILVGDGEGIIEDIANAYKANKARGGSKQDFLKDLNRYECLYVPSVQKDKRVKRNIVMDMDNAFVETKPLVPNIEAVFNRAKLEIFRGCTRGCRYCQAGFVYRPVRERSVGTLKNNATQIIENCGFDEMTLASLSTCDYSHLRELLFELKPLIDKKQINVSLPSTRVDSFEAEFVESSRKSSVTFAPEAGTQRLRDIINKNVTEEDILTSLTKAFQKGYSAVKLYFMLGLPGETDEDAEAIFVLAQKIKRLYKQVASSKKALSLVIGTTIFVPKPFTPFEVCALVDREAVDKRQVWLKQQCRKIGVKFGYCDYDMSMLECIFSRGDARLSKVIVRAYQLGAKFDGWSDSFAMDKWRQAFLDCKVDMQDYVGQMPNGGWHQLDTGIDKVYLQEEYKKAMEGTTTDDCRKGCKNCGLIGVCYPESMSKSKPQKKGAKQC
ncbi:MAG: radical SAM protein [Firmicutes bacterium]|nr:radical SAM protein [Bacillota bacterium]